MRMAALVLGVPLLVVAFIYYTFIHPTRPAAASAATAVAMVAAQPVSLWRVDRSVSDLDGAMQVTLSRGGVILRCRGAQKDGYVLPVLENLGHMLRADVDREQVVRYKLDQGAVHRESWAVSDSFDALFFPRRTLHSLGSAQAITVEFQPEYLQPQTETFDLTGLAEAEKSAGCSF